MGGPGLRVWVSLFLLAVVGCTPARTQLVVGVDSDLDWGPTATLRGVQITVRSNDPEGQLRDRRTVRLGAATPLPASFGVVPLDGDASRRVWIEVRGCGVDGCETPLVTQQAYVGFVEGQTLLLRMTLARACQPVRCDDPRQVCLPATGRCGSASIDAARLSVWTGSVPATAMDAAVDAYDERAASDLQGAVETGGATDVTVADTTTVDRQALLDTSTEDAVDADVAVVDGHVADILLDAIEPVGDATGDAGVDAAGTRGDAEPAPDLVPTDVGLTDLGASPVDAPVACPSPGQTCGGVCVDVSRDDGNCGGCGVRCATGRACVAGACACMGRAVLCAGECVDATTDAANCGACGFRCVAPEHGSTVCSASRCVLACNAGFALSGMTCSPIVAPRQLSPLSSATVTSRRSSLRWVLAAGADGARVQVCRDRNCTVVEQQEEVSGSSVTVRELAPGAHFWRLFGRSGASIGTTAGPTWEFFVGQRSAAIEMSWGTVPDFNGDGLGDLVVGAPLSSSSQTGRVYAYYGVRGGLPSALNFRIASPSATDGSFGSTVASAGDVNGDGYADLAVGAQGRAYVYYGSAGGILTSPSVAIDAPVSGDREFGTSGFASVADLNNDGFADFAIASQRRVYIYRGGPSGLGTVPNQTLVNPDGVTFYGFGRTVASLGDIDADGYTDLAVGADTRMYVYQNGLSGIPANPTLRIPTGGTVTGPGDYNGDGYGDLVAGSDVYWGGMFGFFTSPGQSLSRNDGTRPTNVFKSVGDINGDGYSDIAAGNIVFYGGASGFRVPIVSSSSVLLHPDGYSLGDPVSCVGDVNGDGFADLVYPFIDRNALLFLGASGGAASRPALTLTCPDLSVQFGRSIAARGPTGSFIDLVGHDVSAFIARRRI